MEQLPTSIFIYSLKDLDEYISSNLIDANIKFFEANIKVLNNINKINGSIAFVDSDIVSLGDLKEVSGNFRITTKYVYSNIKSLEKIEVIGGNLDIGHSNVESLGNLKRVGGSLYLRFTNITDLGLLNYVGGDIYLSKRLDKDINFNNITIKGKIKYFNDGVLDNRKLSKKEMGYIDYKGIIPYFMKESNYVSYNIILEASNEQKSFYEIFKKEFFNGNYIYLNGNNNYASVLLCDLLYNYSDDCDFLIKHMNLLWKYYPAIEWGTESMLIRRLEELGYYEESWKMISNDAYVHIFNIIEYECRLKRELLTPELMIKLCRNKCFTNWGQLYEEEIKPFIKKQLELYKIQNKSNFFDAFFKSKELIDRKERPHNDFVLFDDDYYKKFYNNDDDYYFYLKQDTGYLPGIIIGAITEQCKLIINEAENLYRESVGMPRIGEGWVSESELFHKIADYFSSEKIIQHASPKWLGKQHLDIYMPKWNIAIEYQGAQHYKPIDFFGGEDAFVQTQKRDAKKKQLCEKNHCLLLYANEGYVFDDIKKVIEDYIKK